MKKHRTVALRALPALHHLDHTILLMLWSKIVSSEYILFRIVASLRKTEADMPVIGNLDRAFGSSKKLSQPAQFYDIVLESKNSVAITFGFHLFVQQGTSAVRGLLNERNGTCAARGY